MKIFFRLSLLTCFICCGSLVITLWHVFAPEEACWLTPQECGIAAFIFIINLILHLVFVELDIDQYDNYK